MSSHKTLEIRSYGHRYGPLDPIPPLLFDLRDLPNPPRELRRLYKSTGDIIVLHEWLLSDASFQMRIQEARRQVLDYVLNAVEAEDSRGRITHVTVGVGCQLGRHRSVTLVNELASKVKLDLEVALGPVCPWEVRVSHRDLDRKSR